jgi:hypothetical protein
MQTKKELVLKEVENMPDVLVDEILDFILFLKTKSSKEIAETLIISESSLSKDWLKPEEEEAWQNL